MVPAGAEDQQLPRTQPDGRGTDAGEVLVSYRRMPAAQRTYSVLPLTWMSGGGETLPGRPLAGEWTEGVSSLWSGSPHAVVRWTPLHDRAAA